MIRDDEINLVREERLPQCFPVDLLPDGWATLVQCIAFGNLFGREDEVVKAGFHREGKAFSSGGAELGESRGSGEVDDMGAEGGVLLRATGDEVDGGGFEGLGAGGEEGGVLGRGGVGMRMGRGATIEFGVKEEERVGFLPNERDGERAEHRET